MTSSAPEGILVYIYKYFWVVFMGRIAIIQAPSHLLHTILTFRVQGNYCTSINPIKPDTREVTISVLHFRGIDKISDHISLSGSTMSMFYFFHASELKLISQK